MDQTLAFKRKVYVGDEVTARVVVTRVDGKLTRFTTQCFKRQQPQPPPATSDSVNANARGNVDGNQRSVGDGASCGRVLVIEGEARALIR